MKWYKNSKKINTQVTFFCLMILIVVGCSQRLTRQDVEDQISEAREEVQEAQEEVELAIQNRTQFYEDYKESELDQLQTRNDELDSKIKDLKKTSKGSNSNSAAQSDIESAISEFQEEQEEIEVQIKAVKQIEVEDWSSAYEELNEAVSDISRQLDLLEDSLAETQVGR